MKTRYSLPLLLTLIALGVWLYARKNEASGRANYPETVSPILVELFTSEGCSSCPPADRFLEKLDAQPVSGAQIIVLSEHVDYWNHDGWTDPYSNAAYSERQHGYGSRFHLDSVYTPQMVVDGTREFVGNSDSQARQAFAKALAQAKVPVRISDLEVKDGKLRAHIESDPLPSGTGTAEMVFVIALSHADSQVARGENAGRHLTHVAVVRDLSVVGTAESGKPFSKDVSISLGRDVAPNNLRAVAFLQEAGQGHVLGAAQSTLSR